ncbi:hypothetical protein BD408DRAFT_227717 [Parasitella parasitica]|nr:hypothetical protein BD408DRAFT_227717 [Parasitella parasitica]
MNINHRSFTFSCRSQLLRNHIGVAATALLPAIALKFLFHHVGKLSPILRNVSWNVFWIRCRILLLNFPF